MNSFIMQNGKLSVEISMKIRSDILDNKDYFEEVFAKLDNMTDEEFDELLIKSGIEKCPYEEGRDFEIRKNVKRNENDKLKTWLEGL